MKKINVIMNPPFNDDQTTKNNIGNLRSAPSLLHVTFFDHVIKKMATNKIAVICPINKWFIGKTSEGSDNFKKAVLFKSGLYRIQRKPDGLFTYPNGKKVDTKDLCIFHLDLTKKTKGTSTPIPVEVYDDNEFIGVMSTDEITFNKKLFNLRKKIKSSYKCILDDNDRKLIAANGDSRLILEGTFKNISMDLDDLLNDNGESIPIINDTRYGQYSVKFYVTTSEIKYIHKNYKLGGRDKTREYWRVIFNHNASRKSLGKLLIAEPGEWLSGSVDCIICKNKGDAIKVKEQLESPGAKKLFEIFSTSNTNSQERFSIIPDIDIDIEKEIFDE